MRPVVGVVNTGSAAIGQGCLHLLFSHDTDTVRACVSHCQPGDSVVLLHTAVLLLLEREWIKAFVTGISAYVLRSDVVAQGLSELPGNSDYSLISDSGWVELVMRYPHCLSWK